jgi:hypothetical protein
MKCGFCPNEIDENRVINPGDAYQQTLQASALEKWVQITVNARNEQLIVMHVCPTDAARLSSLSLVLPPAPSTGPGPTLATRKTS